MHEVGVPLAAFLLGAEELAHRPVPVNDAEDPGQLIPLLELLDGRLQHPQMTVIVNHDLLAKTIVPQPQHHVDQQLAGHVLTNGNGARHPHVVIGMRTVVERGQGQVDRYATVGGIAPDPLADLADIQRVRSASQMTTVQLSAADRNEDDVVLPPVLLHLPPHRGLDVGTRLAPFDWRRDAVLVQDSVDVLVARIPDLLLHPPDSVILEEQVRLIRFKQSGRYVLCCHLHFSLIYALIH